MVPLSSSKISRVPLYSCAHYVFTHTGLSPSMVRLSRLFWLFIISRWPIPRSLATTDGISIDFFSSGYLDVSVLRVRLYSLWIQLQITYLCRLGFPIRTSPGHRLLASSPKLIAGSYVLLRLLMPRHPPCALLYLSTKTRPISLRTEVLG